jgi:hypothetical protein
MGWLFSERWQKRSDLIEHLVNGNGVKTLRKALVGNHLWCVHEYERKGMPCRFICLYLMRGPALKNVKYDGADRDWWGYKDVDETMGPHYSSCPASFLDMCTAPESEYAYAWRQRIYERARKIREVKIGSKWEYCTRTYEVTKRMSPTTFRVKDDQGRQWKMKASQFLSAERVT